MMSGGGGAFYPWVETDIKKYYYYFHVGDLIFSGERADFDASQMTISRYKHGELSAPQEGGEFAYCRIQINEGRNQILRGPLTAVTYHVRLLYSISDIGKE